MNLPPSEEVSIRPAASASGSERITTEGHWAALGFALPGLLREVWGMHESRMEIHPAIDTEARYDVVYEPPVPRPHAATIAHIRRAIGDKLQLSITTDAQSMGIWVLTAPPNPVEYLPAYASEGGGWVWNSDWTPAPAEIPQNPQAIEEWLKSLVKHIPAIGVGFTQTLILPYSREVLLLGEPEEDGSCPVQIECMSPWSEDRIVSALREQLGIMATKERRSVEMLVVRPRLR